MALKADYEIKLQQAIVGTLPYSITRRYDNTVEELLSYLLQVKRVLYIIYQERVPWQI